MADPHPPSAAATADPHTLPMAVPQPPAGWAVPGYAIEGELGRGGMGVVYKARQLRLNRTVALKTLLGGALAGETVRRFQIEAEALARVPHPHIVQVFECASHQGQPYFALEFVAGGTLAQKLAFTPQDPVWAAGLVEKLARAMATAHQAGVIHRDLKPANVLLTPDGEPKVTDFGLAKQFEASPGGEPGEVTATGAIFGTPSYMAPEQARGDGKTVGPAADVWALGAILYECLTGRPPFKAASALDTLALVLEVEPAAARSVQPRVPRDLETICHRCLQKDPGRRYASAQALADDLRRFLDGRPIQARPVGLAERGWRWARRRPAVAALAGALGLVLLTLAVGGPLVALREAELRAHAEEQERLARAAEAQAREAREKADASAAAARRAQARAVQEAATARAVQDFLDDDLLGLAGTAEQQATGLPGDPEVKVRTLLALAERRIGDRFRDQPAVECALRITLGRAFLSVGDVARAAAQWEKVVAYRLATLGPDATETLACRINLALAYNRCGRAPEAIPIYEDVLRRCRARPGPEHPNVLICQNNLASAYRAAGRHADARRLHEEVLAARLSRDGPDHPETLTSMHNLALACLDTGQRDRGVALLEEAWPRRRAKLGPNHPSTLSSMSQLGQAYVQVPGRAPDALRLLDGVLAAREAHLGADHPDTLLSLTHLAEACEAAGQLERAVGLWEQALVRFRAKGDAQKANSRAVLLNLTTAYRRRLEAVEQVAPDAWPTAHLRALTGGAYLEQGKYERAEPYLTAGYAGLKAQEAALSPAARACLAEAPARLARLYDDWGKPAEAAWWRAEPFRAATGRDLAWPLLWGRPVR